MIPDHLSNIIWEALTDVPNIKDLRPICLLEIFRKLWTSILTYRIHTTWEAQDMLDPSQHGFRANHGTDSASLLLVDALEQAKETYSMPGLLLGHPPSI